MSPAPAGIDATSTKTNHQPERTPALPLSDADPIDEYRWSTWDVGQHGPTPHPDWLVTDLAAVDTDLGVLKTGKEADVHLVERALPGMSRSCLLAAKRYRTAEHRMFHRDARLHRGPVLLTDEGLAHGDLSPFNLLVHRGRLVLIDLPQVVDIVANPQGPALLARDIRIVTDWFTAHGAAPAGNARVGARCS